MALLALTCLAFLIEHQVVTYGQKSTAYTAIAQRRAVIKRFKHAYVVIIFLNW